MTQNVNATFVKTPNNGATQITTGTGQNTAVTVYAGGANGSKITAFIGAGLGTTGAFDVQWGTSSGGALYIYGTVSIPSSAGNNSATPSVNMFNTTNVPGLSLDSDGNPYVFLASSAWTLQARTTALSSAWASSALIDLIVPSAGDF